MIAIGDCIVAIALFLLLIILCDIGAELLTRWENRKRRPHERIEHERWLE